MKVVSPAEQSTAEPAPADASQPLEQASPPHAAPATAHPSTAEALIREARRLQRRRQLRTAMVAALAVAAIAGLLVVTVGGSHPPRGAPSQRPYAGPTPVGIRGQALGRATAYQLTGPIGIAATGDVAYFSDGNRLYRLDVTTDELQRVAGTGRSGSAGDGGPALGARLEAPTGVAVGPDGDVYIATGDRVRRINAHDGTITTVAGTGREGSSGNGGPATRAALRMDGSATGGLGLAQPLAVGPDGALYIADQGNNEVRRVSPAGVITTVAGDGQSGSSGDGGPAVAASLCPPVGVAVSNADDLFIATACGSIREVTARTGTISTVFGGGEATGIAGSQGDHDPVGLAVSGNGRQLYVAEAYGRRLLEVDLTTRTVRGLAGTGTPTLPAPHADAGDGGTALAATFGLPVGITTDRNGDVLVADFFNNAIRQVDTTAGTITTVAGVIPMSPATGHCC